MKIDDSLVDSLMDDWLERDSDTFVYKTKSKRLGWEKSLDKDSSYSSFIAKGISQEDLIKKSYSVAKDFLAVMCPEKKVHLKITPKGGSHTDSKNVAVETSVFDDEALVVEEKLDVFIGLTIHEACHLKYTDFSIGTPISLIQAILNIIEDERIERLCGEETPGFANFLEKVKYYYFDMLFIDSPTIELTPLWRFMNCLINIVRYPKYLKETEIVEFAKYLVRVKEVLLPFPDSTKKALDASFQIYDIIRDLYKDEVKKEEASKKMGSKDASSDSSSSDKGDCTESDTHSDTSSGISLGSSDTSSDASLSSSESDIELTPEQIEKAKDKLLGDEKGTVELLGKISRKAGEYLDTSKVASIVSSYDSLLGEVCEGLITFGSSKDVTFEKCNEDQTQYNKDYTFIRKYIPTMSKILKEHSKEYKLVHRSMRSGTLDTNKLAEAKQGVPTIYLREGEVKTDKITACILIDESGSMCGSRIAMARKAAILINEALKNMPNIELFIYGHSGDSRRCGMTEMIIYREKNYMPRYGLGTVSGKYENRDGVAIYEVAKRVRKQTSNKVMMFVLSDGEPSAASYRGKEAINHTKESVIKAEKLGFSIIQICIDHSYEPSLMFDKYVILDDISNLAFNLSKVIKKALMENIKSHIL